MTMRLVLPVSIALLAQVELSLPKPQQPDLLPSQQDENQDQDCFEHRFPGQRELSEPTSQAADSVDMMIVHREDYKGSLGEDHYIHANSTVTLIEGKTIVLNYEYDPMWRFPDFNPRNLSLLFDGTSVMAGIGCIAETNSDYTTPQRKWSWSCAGATLTEIQRSAILVFHRYTQVFSCCGIGQGHEQLEITIL